MRILITGISGFVAGHLLLRLSGQANLKILGVDRYVHKNAIPGSAGGLDSVQADITDKEAVESIVSSFKPQQLYHLAAQSAVGYSWENPLDTFRINVFGSYNILDAVRKKAPGCRILMVTTSEIYDDLKAGENCTGLDEETAIYPKNPYAISKAAMDFYCRLYYNAYSLDLVVARPFNHIGPGQSTGFVSADFASQIARIEKGLQEPKIYVGNLEAGRDFLDVRDVVSAYCALIEKGSSGQAYNVCSGKPVKISHILEKLVSFSLCKDIEVIMDKDKYRPVEIKSLTGDNKKIMEQTGWRPKHCIEDTLREVLEYWRQKV